MTKGKIFFKALKEGKKGTFYRLGIVPDGGDKDDGFFTNAFHDHKNIVDGMDKGSLIEYEIKDDGEWINLMEIKAYKGGIGKTEGKPIITPHPHAIFDDRFPGVSKIVSEIVCAMVKADKLLVKDRSQITGTIKEIAEAVWKITNAPKPEAQVDEDETAALRELQDRADEGADSDKDIPF